MTSEYDKATDAAVRMVQREAGFNVNGTAWPQTIAYLQERVGARNDVLASAQTPAPQVGYTLPVGSGSPYAPMWS